MPSDQTRLASIKISVVIPTLNRESALLDTVEALLSTSSMYFLELVVVDQSSHPSKLTACDDRRLTYRRMGIKNLPKARNYGASVARGDVILFLDDDVAGVRGVVEAHALAHLRTGASVVTGPILNKGESLVSVHSLTSTQKKKLHLGKLLIPNLNVEYSPLFAPGGNASYRKDVLVALGGFDENFIGSAVGEDAEISHRVRANGGSIIYDPAAAIVHLRVPVGGCRDEGDELKAVETSVFNAHYFCHKVRRRDLIPKYMLGILRSHVLNRRALTTLRVSILARRMRGLLNAWWRTRARTRGLVRSARRSLLETDGSDLPHIR